MKKQSFVITDYIERDLRWEEKQCSELGVELKIFQQREASPHELVEMCAGADYVLTNMASFTSEVLDKLPDLKVLIRHGIGYDNIDVEAATRNGIVFANQATASSEDVAEHAIMLIFETFRKKKYMDKALMNWIHTKNWSSEGVHPIYRLRGKTLGIFGCGNIGSRVLQKVSGLGMNVLVCDPYLSAERYRQLGITHTNIEDLLRESDIITIHCPVTKETEGIFDLTRLRLMKKDAVLINTARGPIVKTQDLVTALKEGIISGAGIDVYEKEPPEAGSEILKMDNLILTPHIAWYSEEGGWDIREMIIDDLKRIINGLLPAYVVNPEVLSGSNLRFKYKK